MPGTVRVSCWQAINIPQSPVMQNFTVLYQVFIHFIPDGKLLSPVGWLAVAAVASAAATSDNKAIIADYVIVGGSPAGLVLAEQLSRNRRSHVVLLEVGPDSINSTVVNSMSLDAQACVHVLAD